ncbi:rhodanese-like domain-containing protein [Marinicellulosiphila megalodicopiae]|uniref:rhodanese-like domain-containing protein n=1 Tax=Marinicellulosiphila megalodicopiae TaxID=2724896 RepID=UPI003BB0BD76
MIAVAVWAVLLFLIIKHESARTGNSLSVHAVTNLINNEGAVVVDVRPSNEYREGHLSGAINIPLKELTQRAKELKKYQEKPVILICKAGQHASSAGGILLKEGFTNLNRLQGGIYEWQASKLPLVKS